MVVGKFVSKIIQSLPSWEVTKYYGRVCRFQLQCLKYRIQTSEAWFNFKSKYMPDSLRNDAEHDDKRGEGSDKKIQSKGEVSEATVKPSIASELLGKIPKTAFLQEKLEKLQTRKKKVTRRDGSREKSSKSNKKKSDKDTKISGASKLERRKT